MLRISEEFVDDIISHAKRDYPNEACGILAGRDGRVEKVHRMSNIDRSPVTYFIDPPELLAVTKEIREAGQLMLGIYHSHTKTAAYPSKTDVEMAFYPDSAYFIVSLMDFGRPVVKAFYIVDGEISETSFGIEKEESG